MRLRILACVLIMFAYSGCDTAESKRIEETRRSLVGAWALETSSGEMSIRRVLVLDESGKFTDRVHAVTSGRDPRQNEYRGEWTYDGTNLKRRYMSENGRQFSGGSIRYATFPLISVSPSELVVKDTLVGEQMVLKRTKEESLP